MEDSFRCRVDKVFGSLGNTAASTAVSPSLWSLTDEEIEKREWNRSKGTEEEEDDESGPTVVRSQLQSDLEDLSDDGSEDEEGEEIDGEKRRRQNRNEETIDDEHWDVQSNIGRDCTLDYEEEEDEYDKVAVGMEQSGDRVYMRDAKFADYGVDELNKYDELPNSLQVAVRDPRANHSAAKIRLREDVDAAGNFDTLQLSENSVTTNMQSADFKKGELDGDNPKSILKKRQSQMDSKSQKRVRFKVELKSINESHKEEHPSGASSSASEACLTYDGAVPEQASDLSQYSRCVPDYIRNPSKYTKYTFDSSEDVDDQSNRKAYMEFFHHSRQGDDDCSSLNDTSLDVPKSVTFIPRRKQDDPTVKISESKPDTGDTHKNKGFSFVVTEEDAQESEAYAMEEDETCLAMDKGSSLQKAGRHYRRRTNNLEDNLT